MKAKYHTAVELLMSHPDTMVAEMMGVRLVTLRRWMESYEFKQALKAREREQAASAKRIARQAVVNAASALYQAASDPAKPDAKVLLDLVKVSGALEADEEDPGAALADLIKQVDAEDAARKRDGQ